MRNFFFLVFLCFMASRAFSQEPAKDTTQNMLIVEKSAQYPGGMVAFYEIITKNLKYPKIARQLGIEGKVFVIFVIDKDGSPIDIKIKDGLGLGCDEEAIRLMTLPGKWQPAYQKDNIVKQRMYIPIFFRLENPPPNYLIVINGAYKGRVSDLKEYFKTIKAEDVQEIREIKKTEEIKPYYKSTTSGDRLLLITLKEDK